MTGSEIRQKLLDGDRVYGTHIVSFGNAVYANMATKLEADFVFICTEHMPVDRAELSTMCHFYAAKGICPIVRVPYPDPYWASMFIDAGAQGIVAPYVETVAQVREIVGVVRYKPLKGKFLQDILDGKRTLQPKMQEYLDRTNSQQFLIIGIESVEAIENLEKLLDNDGVDGVFLGPHDITCSMEIPEEYDNPKYLETIRNVVKRCRKMGKGVGLHGNIPDFLDTEMNFMLNQSDISKMTQKLNAEFREFREYYGDVYTPGQQVSSSKLCIETI